MKKSIILTVLVLFSILLMPLSTENIHDVEDVENDVNIKLVASKKKLIEIEILELITIYRLCQELNSLRVMRKTKFQADAHTNYMIDKENVSHDIFFQGIYYLADFTGV